MINDAPGQIRALIQKRLHVAPDCLTPDASLADLGADSIAMMDLLLDFERAFGFEIPDHEAATIRTVGEAIAAVERLIQARRAV